MSAFLLLAVSGQLWAASGAAAAQPQLVRVSADPYVNSTSQHRTQVEPASLAHGATIVTAFQSGRFFDGGANNIGFATSKDGGHSWTHGFLPRTTVYAHPAGIYGRTSDASVAYDARHKVWLISYLGLQNPAPNAPVDVLVSRSTDGGITWGAPVTVAAVGQFLDKNWSTCDNTPSSPFYGHCYTEFDDNTLNDLLVVSTSTDGGMNWTGGVATTDGSHGLGGQPVVRPNGTLVVPYLGLDSTLFALTISSFMSTDGGVTLSGSTLISEADLHTPNGGIRARDPLPSAQVDKAGTTYVVWNDCRFEDSCAANDMVLSTSANGRTWTPVHRIPVDGVGSGVDHFIPGLAVDSTTSGATAKLGLTYYYYPNTNCDARHCQLDVGFISSTNGGASWSSKVVVAGPMKLTWLPSTSQGTMVGDYVATSIVAGRPTGNGFVALAHRPTGNTFDEATYDARTAITGGNHRLGIEAQTARPQGRSNVRRTAPTAR